MAAPFWDVNLTSAWLVADLAFLTLLTAVATVILWDHPRLRMPRRVGSLLLTQLMVVVTFAALINSRAYFFSSVSDLLNAFAPPAPPPVTGRTVGELSVIKLDTARMEQGIADARTKTPAGHGVMFSTIIDGAETGYQLPAWIYLPTAYFDPSRPSERFPTIELIAGYPGSAMSWIRTMRVTGVLDDLIAKHRIPPIIAVLPAQNPISGRDSECVDAVDGVHADTYLGQDVPEAISQSLRVLPDRKYWAVAGYSTGGFCAANLALHHPQRFSTAIALSGYFTPIVDATTGDLYRGDAAAKRANTPAATIHDKRTSPIAFYLFASRGDPESLRAVRAFAHQIGPPDSCTSVIRRSGGHNFGTWRRALPDAFTWWADGAPGRPSGRC